MSDITGLLHRWSKGDGAAFDALVPLVYEELRRLAVHYLRQERTGHTLQPTALVHEAYLRLSGLREMPPLTTAPTSTAPRPRSCAGCSSTTPAGTAPRSAGGASVRALDDREDTVVDLRDDLGALDDALVDLERIAPEKAKVVELRYFGGLSVEETGEYLQLSPATVKRYWSFSRAWLFRRLHGLVSEDGAETQFWREVETAFSAVLDAGDAARTAGPRPTLRHRSRRTQGGGGAPQRPRRGRRVHRHREVRAAWARSSTTSPRTSLDRRPHRRLPHREAHRGRRHGRGLPRRARHRRLHPAGGGQADRLPPLRRRHAAPLRGRAPDPGHAAASPHRRASSTAASPRGAIPTSRWSTSTASPIIEYCRQHALDLGARLRLFGQLCAAVAASPTVISWSTAT